MERIERQSNVKNCNGKVGKAIAYLRKKVGYTQKELADRIGISDKAVSKWERGLGIPDTSLIGKVAILLDTDTDSLLAGDIVHHNSGWSGLLILSTNAEGIYAGTIIYDKPIINFLLSYFILMGIRNITIVCDEVNRAFTFQEFGDGQKLGLSLTYNNVIPRQFNSDDENGRNLMIVNGMSFIYGVDQTRFFQKAMLERDRITVLSLPKKVTGKEAPSRIYYDSDKKVVTSDEDERLHTQYDYYQIPIMFCPASAVKEMKLTESQGISLKSVKEELYTVILDRGFVEIPINTREDVIDAAMFMKTVQKACGMQLYCIEEIAWRRGLISHEEFYHLGVEKKGTPYGRYILDIASSDIRPRTDQISNHHY